MAILDCRAGPAVSSPRVEDATVAPGYMSIAERLSMSVDDGAPSPHRPITKDGLELLYQSEAPRLTRFFRFRAGYDADPLDLVQEAFARFLRRADKSAPDNPIAYLHRIARNLLFEQSRKSKRHVMRETDLDPTLEIAVPPLQSDRLEALQTMDLFRKSLEQLPPRTREVFLLHRVKELSYKEIAAQLGISVRTVEWHMTEALLRLRRMMDDR